jgi:hypothetical protein
MGQLPSEPLVPPLHFIYVAKLPPHHHGVARHASRMVPILTALGSVEVVPVAASPRSNGFRTVLGVIRAVASATKRRPDGIVWFEVSGSSLAELWAAAYCALRRRRYWLTVHDSPAVTSAPFLFGPLDRRGVRRIPLRYVQRLGRVVEAQVLHRSERVFCLSDVGARLLTEMWQVAGGVETLPAPVGQQQEGRAKERWILCPGATLASAVLPVIEAVACSTVGETWQVRVGQTDQDSGGLIAAAATAKHVRVNFTGALDESALTDEFRGASIVVDLRGNGADDGASRGAILGHSLDAMREGCAFVTSRPRGSLSCLTGSSVIIDAGQDPVPVLVRLLDDESRIRELQARMLNHGETFHNPDEVRSVILGTASSHALQTAHEPSDSETSK